MEDIFSNLYLVLQEKLKSIPISTDNNNSALRMIAEDTGQLQDEVPALSYPCVLINLDDNNPTSLAENCQIGVINVNLKLVCKVFSNTGSLTPQAVKEKGLSPGDLKNKIHGKVQGWSPSDEQVPVQEDADQPSGWVDVFGSMDRIKDFRNKQREDLYIRELVYSVGYQDYSTKTIRATAPATPVITPEITLPVSL